MEKVLKIDVEKFFVLSKVWKVFSRVSKWLKGVFWLDVFGFFFDSLIVGINIWGLKIVIEDENVFGIVVVLLSIVVGLVGLIIFVVVVVMGFVVFGLIGVIIGVVFGFVVMFVEFIGGYFGYDVVVVEVYRNRLRELWNLRDVCRVWID